MRENLFTPLAPSQPCVPNADSRARAQDTATTARDLENSRPSPSPDRERCQQLEAASMLSTFVALLLMFTTQGAVAVYITASPPRREPSRSGHRLSTARCRAARRSNAPVARSSPPVTTESEPRKVSLTATAETAIAVPARAAASLSDYLLSAASDVPLLQAAAGAIPAPDAHGFYTCAQQPVDFFALSVVPVFRESIERRPSTSEIVVTVIDARIEVEEDASAVSMLMSDMAATTEVRGRNVISWSEAADGRGWLLAGTLELTLELPLLGGVPGGRRVVEGVGTRLVRTTCNARLEPYLEDIRAGFLDWVSEAEGALRSAARPSAGPG